MDAHTFRQNAFQPVLRALSDAWLQARAKPLVYLLIWLTLALAPYILLGLAFSDSLVSAFNEFFTATENMGIAESTSQPLPEDFISATGRILGLYSIILAVVSLISIYMGSVLSVTVKRFRAKTMPGYVEVMQDGMAVFPGFFLSILHALARILARPVAIAAVGGLIAYFLKQPGVWSFAFFVGLFMGLAGLYRFGLAPFIHLSLDVQGREACRISREYHAGNRHVVASLFLLLVLLPFIVMMTMYTTFLGAGLFFGAGSIILWLVQSLFQFSIVMTLINFGMNNFRPQDYGIGSTAAASGPETVTSADSSSDSTPDDVETSDTITPLDSSDKDQES